MITRDDRPLLFLDVDGPLIPLRARVRAEKRVFRSVLDRRPARPWEAAVDPQSVRAVVAAAGFVVDDFVERPFLPVPMVVWKPYILVSATPTVRVACGNVDHDGRVDTEWWRLSSRNGTVGSGGAVLLSVEGAGGLPWLQARVGEEPPRASAVGLPGHECGFVALSAEGHASTAVSSEEWETWVFADPIP